MMWAKWEDFVDGEEIYHLPIEPDRLNWDKNLSNENCEELREIKQNIYP